MPAQSWMRCWWTVAASWQRCWSGAAWAPTACGCRCVRDSGGRLLLLLLSRRRCCPPRSATQGSRLPALDPAQVEAGAAHNEAAWAARLPGALAFLLEAWREEA